MKECINLVHNYFSLISVACWFITLQIPIYSYTRNSVQRYNRIIIDNIPPLYKLQQLKFHRKITISTINTRPEREYGNSVIRILLLKLPKLKINRQAFLVNRPCRPSLRAPKRKKCCKKKCMVTFY